MMDVKEAVALLAAVLKQSGGRLPVIDVRDYLLDSKRQNEKRNGQITVELHDEVVKALRGPQKKATHRVMMVLIPTDVEKRALSTSTRTPISTSTVSLHEM